MRLAGWLQVLDQLTGVPRGDDLLLMSIPVCGPYSALQGYKFKIKITPGGWWGRAPRGARGKGI